VKMKKKRNHTMMRKLHHKTNLRCKGQRWCQESLSLENRLQINLKCNI
jgi:hypothetical protein